LAGIDSEEDGARFIHKMYYLLGFMVGDAGKNLSATHPRARLQLDLSRKYKENLALGNYVMVCVSQLGVPCGRIADRPPGKRDRHGLYRWSSYFSEALLWLYTACLGLRRVERTSYNPVRMKWLLTASTECRAWFLRGIADSDGTVSLRDKTVVITSEPNTIFFKDLLGSLGIHARTHESRGFGYVTISATDAFELEIFNPEVDTHRGLLLRRLTSARTFQRRWPSWLEARVSSLTRDGLDAGAIRDRLLHEDGTYVKLRTIRTKQCQQKKPALGVDPRTPRLRGV